MGQAGKNDPTVGWTLPEPKKYASSLRVLRIDGIRGRRRLVALPEPASSDLETLAADKAGAAPRGGLGRNYDLILRLVWVSDVRIERVTRANCDRSFNRTPDLSQGSFSKI